MTDVPFDELAALDAVAAFCRTRNVQPIAVSIVGRLDAALTTAELKGPDLRWRTIPFWSPNDDPGQSLFGYEFRAVLTDVAHTIYERILQLEGTKRRVPTTAWLDANSVVPVGRWARFSRAMRDALDAGLGWLVPVRGDLLLVPMPELRTAEGRTDVLHDDSGQPAIEWPDGTGDYYLDGTEFDRRLYFKVIRSELLIQQIAALPLADQRSIALTYLSFDRLVLDSDAELLDVGSKGTRLYRLELPFRIRSDRVAGYGAHDYFIHMRDASHPEREFIEWVDPQIGRLRNAELCQANAFGISLAEWLSIEQEG
ncbi:hypothetical protein [Mycolicibacterium sp.]|uniref:hypothetical protein n=1 Tax=Mycolicibacterium sp. TaxID=2320850 RepID=UPI001A1B2A0A|nr:hypothetical protein [Mycolicibacterium sp.]MBJ7336582.1 hypothetical protein [Mycolicibacterium sp.]